MEECLACNLTNGKLDLPGGRIYATLHWVVEHCIGPLGVGTLIVKPFRHCVHLWELNDEEARELGPLLCRVAATIQAILKPDQVYVCLWSHAGWKPGHLHFVLQPSWNHWQREHQRPGPFLQVELFEANVQPPREEIEAFAAKAREVIRALEFDAATSDNTRLAVAN
jgi:diadenosine tetraphosphate (Ap4A) HIT family hydrolase